MARMKALTVVDQVRRSTLRAAYLLSVLSVESVVEQRNLGGGRRTSNFRNGLLVSPVRAKIKA